MSKFVSDVARMHKKFGVNDVIRGLDAEKLRWFLEFRKDFLQEELDELGTTMKKFDKGEITGLKAADDTVDALIDLIVVAITTLDAYEVDTAEAWKRVHQKNMMKKAGVNPNRPNELGLPDLIKPKNWTAPTHADNIGLLSKVFDVQ